MSQAKHFKTYLETRLNQAKIQEIEEAAHIELEALKTLQNDVSKAVIYYMSEKDIGFNELVRKSGKSPSQLSKIIKGEANLTMATIAQLYAMMKCRPHIVGKLTFTNTLHS